MQYCLEMKKQKDGYRNIHQTWCRHINQKNEIENIGKYQTPDIAILVGKRIYENADGCRYCMPHFCQRINLPKNKKEIEKYAKAMQKIIKQKKK